MNKKTFGFIFPFSDCITMNPDSSYTYKKNVKVGGQGGGGQDVGGVGEAFEKNINVSMKQNLLTEEHPGN